LSLQRDGLWPLYGLDESGRMDGLALAWIVMMPERQRPLILQKAGGLQGIFCYAAFAPTRGIGAFSAINKFDFAAATAMAQAVNGFDRGARAALRGCLDPGSIVGVDAACSLQRAQLLRRSARRQALPRLFRSVARSCRIQ
jgi:hypothetical protein